jgi:flagellar biosynthesis/type III secretory pathway M-ring protein FliF/YscJ
VAAVLLGLAGVALIGVGVFALGLRRRPGEEPMDDDS